VVTDELFARPEEAAESETTLSLASGATPSSTSALLLQRKELPTTEACGYEFGCRHLNMGRFLEQLDPDVVRAQRLWQPSCVADALSVFSDRENAQGKRFAFGDTRGGGEGP